MRVFTVDEQQFNSNFLGKEITESDKNLDYVNLLLYIKDKFNISNTAWHELSVVSKGLPLTYSLKKRIEARNKNWHIFPTPGSSDGVQIKLEDSLKEQTERLLAGNIIKANETLKIKLSGDGTRIGKRLQLLNVTYTIINERKVAATEKGNYVLAIIKTKDDYEGIRDCLKDVR